MHLGPEPTEKQQDDLRINQMRGILARVKQSLPSIADYEEGPQRDAACLILGSINAIECVPHGYMHHPHGKGHTDHKHKARKLLERLGYTSLVDHTINKGELLAAVVALNPQSHHAHEAKLPEGFRQSKAYAKYIEVLTKELEAYARSRNIPQETVHLEMNEGLMAMERNIDRGHALTMQEKRRRIDVAPLEHELNDGIALLINDPERTNRKPQRSV